MYVYVPIELLELELCYFCYLLVIDFRDLFVSNHITLDVYRVQPHVATRNQAPNKFGLECE